jgi:hypothetical protein
MHEEFHDKTTDRFGNVQSGAGHHRKAMDPTNLPLLQKASTAWEQHAAPPLARWRSVANDRVSAIRAAVEPFLASHRPANPAKVAVVAGLLSCLGVAALAQGGPAVDPTLPGVAAAAVAADRAAEDRSSRSDIRNGVGAVDGGGASAVVKVEAKSEAAEAAAEAAAAAKEAAAKKAAGAKAKNQVVWRTIKPVAGLSQKQMDNAQRIVNQGRVMRMPKRALVLAVACAMQESRLLNLASTAVPQSYNYWHEGQGSDHDSVGLFQQRPSSGWGSVKDLMRPAYSSKQFYNALNRVSGWHKMKLTYAIQAVQVSAYPTAYAKHEKNAQAVVNRLLQ